jgi:hypothetical protein
MPLLLKCPLLGVLRRSKKQLQKMIDKNIYPFGFAIFPFKGKSSKQNWNIIFDVNILHLRGEMLERQRGKKL